MKWKQAAQGLIILWIATVGTFFYFFYFGIASKSDDGRTTITLKAAERDVILAEMRDLLKSVQGIVDGVANNDFKEMETSARSVGMKMAQDVNPALIAKLPLSFKSVGMEVHRSFDQLAKDIESKKLNKQQVLSEVSEIMNSCIGCHDSFKLVESK